MVRFLAYFLFGTVLLGTVLTPGLGAFALVAAPFVGLWFVWRVALTVVTGGRATEAVVHTRRNHFLGPGGPDDSFADESLHEDDYRTAERSMPETAPTPSPIRNGGRPLNIPRPAPPRPLPAATRLFHDGA
jgi:hypothetical protein